MDINDDTQVFSEIKTVDKNSPAAVLPPPVSMDVDEPDVSELMPVDPEHLPLLNGFNFYRKVKADGACLTNCAAIHIFGNEEYGPMLKKLLYKHIDDNWEIYYRFWISFPYVETIGVGKNAKKIELHTEEEYLSFIRSDES